MTVLALKNIWVVFYSVDRRYSRSLLLSSRGWMLVRLSRGVQYQGCLQGMDSQSDEERYTVEIHWRSVKSTYSVIVHPCKWELQWHSPSETRGHWSMWVDTFHLRKASSHSEGSRQWKRQKDWKRVGHILKPALRENVQIHRSRFMIANSWLTLLKGTSLEFNAK